MSQYSAKRPAPFDSANAPKRPAQESPKPIIISGLSAGVAKFKDSEYEFPPDSTIELPAGSVIVFPRSAGHVRPKNGSVIYLPNLDKRAVLLDKATLIAPDGENIKIGAARCPSVGLPIGTGITCGNTLKHPEPLKQAITITHKLTLPSDLTLSSREPTLLPGPLPLSSRLHFGGNNYINGKTQLLSGVINTSNSLSVLDDIKLGGDLFLMGTMELKTPVKLAGRLLLMSQITVSSTTDVSDVIKPPSSMQVDKDKTITLPIDSILPTNFTIPKGTRLVSTTMLPKGTILPKGNSIPAGCIIPAGTQLPPSTVIPGGAVLPENIELQAGTILPFTALK